MRIVFPTKEKMSYISHSASSLKEADYLTILNVRGQNITSVETLKNHSYKNNEELVNEFKQKEYSVLILPSSDDLPVKDLKNIGISVFEDKESQVVINAFSDFVQDKLKRA